MKKKGKKLVVIHFYQLKPWEDNYLLQYVQRWSLNEYIKYADIPECNELYKKAVDKILKSQVFNELGSMSYEIVKTNWLKFKMQGIDIKKIFCDKHYKKIAVYGIGSMCELFCNDIRGKGVEIKYFIDQSNKNQAYENRQVVAIEDINQQEKFDAITVTPIYNFLK